MEKPIIRKYSFLVWIDAEFHEECNDQKRSVDVQYAAIVNVSVYYSMSRMWLLLTMVLLGTERQGIAVYGPKSTKKTPSKSR